MNHLPYLVLAGILTSLIVVTGIILKENDQKLKQEIAYYDEMYYRALNICGDGVSEFELTKEYVKARCR